MKEMKLKGFSKPVPRVAVGCMRFAEASEKEMNGFVHAALDEGCFFFDHADIYGGGKCEEIFGRAVSGDASIQRENLLLQSKCGIRPGICYDLSKKYILSAVEGILSRLRTDYLDILLLHRPDALMEPEEVAAAFDELSASGKVRAFGVSNFKPTQIELLKKCVNQPLIIDQIQFSIPMSSTISQGMEMNMLTDGAVDRDGNVLDYCRLNDLTVQAWSPFQSPGWKGLFLTDSAYAPLNETLSALAKQYGVSETMLAAAWIFRHPARMQIVSGTTKPSRLKEIAAAAELALSREDWYKLYLAAGHILP